MKKILLVTLLVAITTGSFSQKTTIRLKEVERIETILASDKMQGREAFTPAADKAAAFISREFKKAGLQYLPGLKTFSQTFVMVKPELLVGSASFNGQPVNASAISVFSCKPHLKVVPASGYKIDFIKAGENFADRVIPYTQLKENAIVFTDTSFAKRFSRLNFLKSFLFSSEHSVIFILGNYVTDSFEIDFTQRITEVTGKNVVGVLPGSSNKSEKVIFSGHYDHLGIKKGDDKDSVFNGANDDAAGVTAVIALARHFKKQKNGRTLIFAAFTAEEMGGFGSTYFSQQLNPEEITAMFNIEMIGTESKWGKNSAYITGFEKTDMGKLLQNNLAGSSFTFYPDPYIKKNLFYRSDNASLARLGVPAHTISTSKMDNEPNYHKVSDEVHTLNLHNMTEIIKAIALSAEGIVAGKETPTRVSLKTPGN